MANLNKQKNKLSVSLERKEKKIAIDFNYNRWFPIIVALFAFFLYTNTLSHQYVLDDFIIIVNNSIVTKGIKAIPEIMKTAYTQGGLKIEQSSYRPLSLIMFAFEWQLAPFKPFIGHLINVLLYAITGFLVYKLLKKWLNDKHPIIILSISLLFISHPLHTEVVANIKSRDEILAFLFSTLAMNSFYEYAISHFNSSKKKILYLILGSFFFFFAILSKETPLTLIFVIPLSIFFFTKENNKKVYFCTILSLVIPVIIYFILRKNAIGDLVSLKKLDLYSNSLMGTSSYLDRFATAIVLVGYYIRLFFIPHPLSWDYAFNTFPIANFTDWRFLFSAAIIVFLSIYSIINIKKKKKSAFGILYFFITLSIVSNIFFLIESTLSERFMYLPSLGLCISTIISLERYTNFSINSNFSFTSTLKKNKLFTILLLSAIALFSIKTFSRNFEWKNNLTLFSADIEHNPNSFRVLVNYANTIYNEKIIIPDEAQKMNYIKEAKEYVLKSLSFATQNTDSWLALGKILTESDNINDLKDAKYALVNASNLNKTNDETWYALGNIYTKLGEHDSAIASYKKAEKWNPSLKILANSNYGIGKNYVTLKQYDKAIDAFTKSLKIDSTNADIWLGLGNSYAKIGDYLLAIVSFKKIEILNASKTTLSSALNNIGMCYFMLEKYDEALEYFQKSLIIHSNTKGVLGNIIETYTKMGNMDKAQEYNYKLQLIP